MKIIYIISIYKKYEGFRYISYSRIMSQEIMKSHRKAINHIKNKKKPTLTIIREVLGFYVENIQKEDFNLCKKIVENAITLDLPKPYTDKAIIFSKFAGPNDWKSAVKYNISGCYRIWGDESDDMCYIGQSKYLGPRVKKHAYGWNINTRKFCSNLGGKGKVSLYIIPKNKIRKELTINQFLCILEQYLIFKYRPKINKVFVAIPGVIWNKERILKHKEIMGKKLYIYIRSSSLEDTFEYIYLSPSHSHLSLLLGYNRLWAKGVMRKGVKVLYRQCLFLSLIPIDTLLFNGKLCTIIKNLKSENDLKSYIFSKLTKATRAGTGLKVTNVKSGEIFYFISKGEASQVLKLDPSGFYNRGDDNLLKKTYKVEIMKS